MRHRYSSIIKKTPAHTGWQNSFNLFPAVAGDSAEVMEMYYSEKIQALEHSLRSLTILDDAREIAFLCREIKCAKETLNKIYRNNRYDA